MSSYKNELEKFLGTLEIQEDSVLDLGGAANPVRDRVKSWKVKNYKIMDNCLEENTEKEHWQTPDYIWDLNQPLLEITINKKDIKFYLLNEEIERNSFDLIFCLEVSEYLFSPLVALENIHKLLKPEGRLIISWPTTYPVHNPMVHDCLRYTEFGIYKLMEEAGFEIEDMIPRRAYHPNLLSDFYKAEGLHPAKHYGFHGCLGWVCVCRRKK